MRTIVVNVDWVIDPPIRLAVANNVNCTKGRQWDRGCGPGISKGAPVFRYWSKPVVNDLSEAKSRKADANNRVRARSDCRVQMLNWAQDRSSFSRQGQKPNNPPGKSQRWSRKFFYSFQFSFSPTRFTLGSVTIDARLRIAANRTKVPVRSGHNRSGFPRGTIWAVVRRSTGSRTVGDGIDFGWQQTPSMPEQRNSGDNRWWFCDGDNAAMQ